jgi:hypothetical protein
MKCDHAVSVDNLTDADLQYFALKEQHDQVRERAEALEELLADRDRRSSTSGLLPPHGSLSRGRSRLRIIDVGVRRHLLDSLIEREIQQYLDEVFQAARIVKGELENAVIQLRRELNLLKAMMASVDLPRRVLLFFHQLVRGATLRVPVPFRLESDPRHSTGFVPVSVETYGGRYTGLFQREFGIDSDQLRGLAGQDQYVTFIALTGIPAYLLARTEEGIHLVFQSKGDAIPIQVRAIPVPDDVSPKAAAESVLNRIDQWRTGIERGTCDVTDEPFPLGCVNRVLSLQRCTIDLKSGLSTPTFAKHSEMRQMMLANLETMDLNRVCEPGGAGGLEPNQAPETG